MSMAKVPTDDYVADLLKRDAKDSKVGFSALGAFGALPVRPTTAAPKPNTRFLRNIIRETDSHNASLLLREDEQARLRLKGLKADGPSHGKRSAQEKRRRSPGRVRNLTSPDEARSKRRQIEHDDEGSDLTRHRDRRRREEEGSSRRTHHSRRGGAEKELRRREDMSEQEHCQSSLKERERRRPRSCSSTSRQRLEDRHGHRHPRTRAHHHSHGRSRSPSLTRQHRRSKGHRHQSPRSERERIRVDAPKEPGNKDDRQRGTRSKRRTPPPRSSPSCSDSDPLDALIGPMPPPKVKSRGRGTFAASTSSKMIDSHFSSKYDPAVDVQPNPESEDDWDQALEALRDRQRWKQQGADRLRAAGFTPQEVEKWETGGSEKRAEQVRWGKKGEGREWDRGKVVDEDGEVGIQPEWGRLKGP